MTDTTKPNGDRRHAWARPSRSEVSGRVSRGAMMRRRSSSSNSSVEARERMSVGRRTTFGPDVGIGN